MSDRNPSSDPPVMPTGRAGISEEDTTQYSSPAHNLVGAALFGVIGLIALAVAIQMPNPDTRMVTAPGLLPGLVGASLILMSLVLASGALRNGAVAQLSSGGSGSRIDGELRRTFLLMAIVAFYIVLLDLIFFEWTVVLAGERISWGSFELYSGLMLALILKLFWRGKSPHCLLIGLVFATSVSAIFRYIFVIPVPGSG